MTSNNHSNCRDSGILVWPGDAGQGSHLSKNPLHTHLRNKTSRELLNLKYMWELKTFMLLKPWHGAHYRDLHVAFLGQFLAQGVGFLAGHDKLEEDVAVLDEHQGAGVVELECLCCSLPHLDGLEHLQASCGAWPGWAGWGWVGMVRDGRE